MHILFLTPEYPHQETARSGGLGTSIKNLAIELVKKGITVSIVVPYQSATKICKDQSITIHSLKSISYSIMGWYLYKKSVANYINELCAKEHIDIIEAPDWTGITSFMKLNRPLVVRLNGSDAYFCKLEDRPQKKKNRWLEKHNLQNADYLLSASDFTARVTRDIFHLKKPITTIHNSVDVELFKPIEVTCDKITLLYFGTVIRKKGVFDLVQMFNNVATRHSKVELLVVGKDSVDVFENESTILLLKQQLTQEARNRTSFIQEVPYAEIKNHIARATVITLPSYAEALPMTWIESMAMEKAMVTSNIGWAAEVMMDGVTGYTVLPSDHRLYTSRVLKLLEDADLRKKMGIAARLHVKENFAASVVVQKNIDFYQKVIDS